MSPSHQNGARTVVSTKSIYTPWALAEESPELVSQTSSDEAQSASRNSSTQSTIGESLASDPVDQASRPADHSASAASEPIALSPDVPPTEFGNATAADLFVPGLVSLTSAGGLDPTLQIASLTNFDRIYVGDSPEVAQGPFPSVRQTSESPPDLELGAIGGGSSLAVDDSFMDSRDLENGNNEPSGFTPFTGDNTIDGILWGTECAAKAAEKAGDSARARVYSGKVVAIADGADKSRTEVADAREFLARNP